jgi:hypothetical protein
MLGGGNYLEMESLRWAGAKEWTLGAAGLGCWLAE